MLKDFDTRSAIALALVAAMIGMAFVLVFRPTVPDSDVFKMLIGGLMTVGFATIISFYFGSSAGSKAKDDTLNQIAVASAAPNGVPQVAPVADPAKPTVTDAAKTAVMLLAVGLTAFLLLGAPAFAQTKPSSSPAINNIGTWAEADLDAAIALSASITGMQDNVGSACWTTFKNVANVLKAHPLPQTLRLATDIEAARLVVAGLNQICRDPNCSQIWSDMSNFASALSVVPLPISFASICAKVPVVGIGTQVPTK